jgi:ubiquinone/menaquinone biosynthesis C-methylase UbiE
LQQVFDCISESYDHWYDTPEGRAIFHAELKCIRTLCGHLSGRWLEAGVGTGRFASSLGIGMGIDPSLPMLRIAAKRGILTCAGFAESMPFPDDAFHGVLLALALCFVTDSDRALKECSRVIKPGGRLLLGLIPADGPWGRAYERKKEQGHPIYRLAVFPRIPEISASVDSKGFRLEKAASTLFWNPDERPENAPRVENGIHPQAGFLGLLYAKK